LSSLKKILHFGSYQVLIQLFNAVSGILMIRWLPKEQYALYALFFSIQTIINMASGVGINTAMSVIGGRIHDDKNKLGILLNTINQKRVQVLKIVVVPILIYAVWLLYQNNIDVKTTGFTLFFLVVYIFFQIRAILLGDIAKLLSKYKEIGRFDLFPAIAKAIGVVFLFLLASLNYYSLIFIVTISLVIQYLYIRKVTVPLYNPTNHTDPDYNKQIIVLIKRSIFSTFFYLFQGQIVIVLLSIFSGVDNIANFTAMGRIAILLSIFSNTINGFFLPIASRSNDASDLRKLFKKMALIYLVILSVAVLLSYSFPELILKLLGSQYSSYKTEFVILIFGACFSEFISFMWGFIFTKGWIEYQWAYPLLTIAIQIILIFLLNLKDFKQILWFNIISSLGFFLVNIFTLRKHLFSHKLN
jgi:O-antigen/teichoic acid export membrane protein